MLNSPGNSAHASAMVKNQPTFRLDCVRVSSQVRPLKTTAEKKELHTHTLAPIHPHAITTLVVSFQRRFYPSFSTNRDAIVHIYDILERLLSQKYASFACYLHFVSYQRIFVITPSNLVRFLLFIYLAHTQAHHSCAIGGKCATS